MEAVWRLKQAQCCHLVVHCSSYLRIMSNVTLKAHPIVMMASLFWQLLVQMDILSPLGLTLTTAPQTSSLASSNDSPTKHNSCKKHKKKSNYTYIHLYLNHNHQGKHPMDTTLLSGFRKQPSYRFHPVAIEVIVPLLFVESHQPSTPQLVPVVLPHGLDPILTHNMKQLLNPIHVFRLCCNWD